MTARANSRTFCGSIGWGAGLVIGDRKFSGLSVPGRMPSIARIRQRRAPLINRRKLCRHLGVDGNELALSAWHFIVRKDRLHRAFRHAEAAVDARFRVDVEHLLALPK